MHSRHQDRPRVRLAASLAVTALLGVPALAPAEVPATPPTFTNPLQFTNEFFPFVAGAMKVYRGTSEGDAFVVVEHYLTETRAFAWGGGVETRILREIEFQNGKLIEISDNFYAQADDGSIYYFGEVVDEYEDGVVVSHEGTWLVGGPANPSDPADAANAGEPGLFMLANPEVGEQYKSEDLWPILDETVTILGFETVTTDAGKFKGALKVRETSELPGENEPERKWYARGVGLIHSKGEGDKLRLISSTLQPPKVP